MRFLHYHTNLSFYSRSDSSFITLWACICIVLLFPLQADSSSPAYQDGDLFLNEPRSDSNSNLFLDDDSSYSDFTGLLMEPPPILDDIALTSGLADASDDECGMNNVLPSSSSSKSRLRPRLTADLCKNPNAVEGAEGIKNPTTAEQIKITWCAGTKVPIPEFGNVPVCEQKGQAIFSEYLLPDNDQLSNLFQTVFRGIMITPLLPDICGSQKVWCCNNFLEDFVHTIPFDQEPMGPTGTGFWCVKALRQNPS